MNKSHSISPAYGKLCSLFYDITKEFAPQREVDFYASFIKEHPGRVLEAMSGSGRLQIPLIQRGFVVDGVDNSPSMLEQCRIRCAKLNLNPEIFEQSLQGLNVPHKYTTVTIAVGSFQLINDWQQAVLALKNLRKHMVDNGNLLIDFFVPDTTVDPRSVRTARIDEHQFIRLTTRHIFDERAQRATAFCTYELVVDGKTTHQEQELMEVRWYTTEELYALFAEAGFDIVNISQQVLRGPEATTLVHVQPKAIQNQAVV